MSDTHPYTRFDMPQNVPFQLKPSTGKGWGGFATQPIPKGTQILLEHPLFVVHMNISMPTEQEFMNPVNNMTSWQKQQFRLLLEDNGRPPLGIVDAIISNHFDLVNPDHKLGRTIGVFALMSRFNHACVPNSELLRPSHDSMNLAMRTVKDIVAGEEITFCYVPMCDRRTRQERHEILHFECTCTVCLADSSSRYISDMRRRLLRGLFYLTYSVDIDGDKPSSGPHVILDEKLRRVAENHSIPLTSLLIYEHLAVVLLEQEGVLTDCLAGHMENIIVNHMKMSREACHQHAMLSYRSCRTWQEKFWAVASLWGRSDAGDGEAARALKALSTLFRETIGNTYTY